MIQKPTPKVKENTQIFEYIYDNPPPADVNLSLADVSERDNVWDTHRAITHDVAQIYGQNDEFERFSERMKSCSTWLQFGFTDGFKLKSANFCRVRNCPVCQWRKSLLWKAMMFQTYDTLKEQYPNHRWVFLTLTVRNCHISELRSTLNSMHTAWRKLIQRKELGAVDGWIRTTEVTRDKQDPNTHAHPHYHAMLLVKPSYFSHGYIKQMDWVLMWGACLKVDYLPNVDVRAVKAKGGNDDRLRGAIAETLKYAVKPSDMVGDGSPQSVAWFWEYTRQVHKLRFVASGGALKNALKDGKEITNQDMITTDTDTATEETDKRRLNFTFYPTHRKYIYNPKYNV